MSTYGYKWQLFFPSRVIPVYLDLESILQVYKADEVAVRCPRPCKWAASTVRCPPPRPCKWTAGSSRGARPFKEWRAVGSTPSPKSGSLYGAVVLTSSLIITSYPKNTSGIIVSVNSKPRLFLLKSTLFQGFLIFKMMRAFQFDLNEAIVSERRQKSVNETLDRERKRLFVNNDGPISCKAEFVVENHVKPCWLTIKFKVIAELDISLIMQVKPSTGFV